MPISPFRKRGTEPETASGDVEEQTAAGGPERVILSRGLYAEWYVMRRLNEELERARRYERPLAVMLAEPMVIAGRPASAEALAAGATAAQASARGSDLIGWIAHDRILIIMPETDAVEASVATRRWRDEMWRRSQHAGGLKWRIAALEDASTYADPAQCVEAARERVLREAA